MIGGPVDGRIYRLRPDQEMVSVFDGQRGHWYRLEAGRLEHVESFVPDELPDGTEFWKLPPRFNHREFETLFRSYLTSRVGAR